MTSEKLGENDVTETETERTEVVVVVVVEGATPQKQKSMKTSLTNVQ
jgi:hypothetical protein